MQKLIILGCSISWGSYVPNDTSIDGPFEQFEKGSRGWYHFVDWIKDYDTTVFPCPGMGYLAWTQIINIIDLSIYDKIIIQETSEPRTWLLNEQKLEQSFKTNFIDQTTIIDNIKLVNIGLLGAEHTKGVKYYAPTVDIWSLISSSWAVDYIKTQCIKNNVTGYVWSRSFRYMDNTYLKRLLPDIPIYTELAKNNGTTSKANGAHQTLDGCKYLGNLLNNGIKNIWM
mgnify:FL=1